MKKYRVKFPNKALSKKFTKTLEKIPFLKFQTKVKDEILNLADNPRPCGNPKIKPPIEVYNFTAQYRLRIGDYRVLYDIDDKKKIIWIFALRKRSEKTYK